MTRTYRIAVLVDLDAGQALDGILIAGDTIPGPDQQRVIERLTGLQAVMIQGNNEVAITRIADPIRMAHGSPRSVNEMVCPENCTAFLQKILKFHGVQLRNA